MIPVESECDVNCITVFCNRYKSNYAIASSHFRAIVSKFGIATASKRLLD